MEFHVENVSIIFLPLFLFPVPYIGFVQNYTFTEGDTTAAVQLNINGVIYQDITISLEGGIGGFFVISKHHF